MLPTTTDEPNAEERDSFDGNGTSHDRASSRSWGVCLAIVVVLGAVAIAVRTEPGLNSPAPLQIGDRVPTSVRTQMAPRTRAFVSAKRIEGPLPAPRTASESPLIRVNVTPGGSEHLQLAISGPYSIRAVSTSRATSQPRDSNSSRELSRGDSLSVARVEPAKNGLKIGRATFAVDRLEIVSQSAPSIRVNGHLYRGDVRLFKRTDGRVSAVNVLPIEEYLASVVDSEMPASFHEAARCAQAIIARTYARYQQAHADPAAVYDLLNSQRSQKYLGVEYTDSNGRRLAGESVSSRRAVADTRGIVLQYKARLFSAYYSAVCGGRTTDGTELFKDAAPVLKSVPCEWCRESKYFRWTADVSERDFLDGLQDLKPLTAITSIQQTAGPGDGVISRFRIVDGQQSLGVSGVELRERLPPGTLRSPHFSLTLNKHAVRVAGRGHGHGVGLCQWGANGQAHAGKSCFEIVRHYYPGATLVVEE